MSLRVEDPLSIRTLNTKAPLEPLVKSYSVNRKQTGSED